MTNISADKLSVYDESLKLSAEHYENFPVASFLFSKSLRKDVAVIYTFARTADDIADEGNFTPEERKEKLNLFRNYFTDAMNGNYSSGFWQVFHSVIKKRNLDPQLFYGLLSAFEQDITKKRYKNYDELLDYCRRSANPVGRIILSLYNINDTELLSYSDKICSALQITNFIQDVSADIKKGRIYLTEEDMIKFEVDEKEFNGSVTSGGFRHLIKHEVNRTEKLFREGEDLLGHLPYRLKLQVAWTINGGRCILRKIENNNYNVLNYRPSLSKIDYINELIRALIL